jgi:hypothetical protein
MQCALHLSYALRWSETQRFDDERQIDPKILSSLDLASAVGLLNSGIRTKFVFA